MCFSDSTNYNIPEPIKYANSDSAPFNSHKSLSDDNSSQDNLAPPTPSNYEIDFPSKHNSLTKMNDNQPFKQRSKTFQKTSPCDTSRLQPQNQSVLLNRYRKNHKNSL